MAILAGGLATRLRSLTSAKPKSMVKVLGKQIERYLGDRKQSGINTDYSHEERPLTTAGALKEAEDMLEDPFNNERYDIACKKRGTGEDSMKAIFLDRDGVINNLVYHQERGIIDSPFTVEQLNLLPGVDEAIRKFHEMDYKVVLVSNQPAIAKGYLSEETFEAIRKKMKKELAKGGAFLDGEYYCLHYPEAKVERLKTNCECRKPRPGLLLQAARDMNIDLSQSWMIGDGLTDINAGENAGCRTILLVRMKGEFCHLLDEERIKPDTIATNLNEAAQFILKAGERTRISSLTQQASLR